ncbi:MAG: hypothetical protein ACRELB_23470, partial [Polyangiaceae bacterium]
MTADISGLGGSADWAAQQQRRSEDKKAADFNDLVKKQLDRKLVEKKIVEKDQREKGDLASSK